MVDIWDFSVSARNTFWGVNNCSTLQTQRKLYFLTSDPTPGFWEPFSESVLSVPSLGRSPPLLPCPPPPHSTHCPVDRGRKAAIVLLSGADHIFSGCDVFPPGPSEGVSDSVQTQTHSPPLPSLGPFPGRFHPTHWCPQHCRHPRFLPLPEPHLLLSAGATQNLPHHRQTSEYPLDVLRKYV